MRDIKLNFFGKEVKADVRMLREMKEVLHDKEWLKKSKNFSLYFMYRDLSKKEKDKKFFENFKVRYDITFIPGIILGCEYNKTLGHYHPLVPNKNLTYPEVYEVLEGKAHYLLQNFFNGAVTDVILIEAKKGDIVIIPPNYGHITINPSEKKEEELKMANLVSREFSSLYDFIKEKRGGAYFELIKHKFVKNENYSELPAIRILKPLSKEKKEKFFGGKNLYDSFIEKPERFRFLNEPQKYKEMF